MIINKIILNEFIMNVEICNKFGIIVEWNCVQGNLFHSKYCWVWLLIGCGTEG